MQYHGNDDPMWTTAPRPKPILIVVSGPPGSGKTTLARALSRALPCPLIARDDINEGIFHTVQDDPELARKDFIAATTFYTMFGLIGLLVSAHAMVVAEAAFQDHRWRIGLEPLMPAADIRIVHCVIDAQLAHQRIASREPMPSAVTSATRMAVHGRTAAKQAAALRPFEPLLLPVPTLHVSTVDGYDPGLDEIVAFARSR